LAAALGLKPVTAEELRRVGISKTAALIRERVQDAPVFVSFDIDFLDPAYAPGTGTPEIGGFTTWEALSLVRESLRGLQYTGFDLVEVLPACDNSQITAFAAAGIIYELISLVAKEKESKQK